MPSSGDDRPDAYERLVDRLLDSPHYGERWGQHWLDLAHYADSNGFELDAERPDAWRYRDWVVRTLNADMPYDRFLSLQLAGDEIVPGDHDALIATGFCRCGPREVVGGNVIPEVKRQSELSEITGTVGSVFLGLTIGCARCHDHKFDAIPTTDYYRLQSFFAASQLEDVADRLQGRARRVRRRRRRPSTRRSPRSGRSWRSSRPPIARPSRRAKQGMLSAEERAVMNTPAAKRTAGQKRLAQGLETSLRVTWEDVAAAVAADPAVHRRREELKRAIDEIERTLPRPPAHAMALVDHKSKAADTFVLRRGDYKNRGPRVAPRPPGVILASQQRRIVHGLVDRRRPARRPDAAGALARWLASPANPLTARVIVNRLWQHHFGRGIVATPSDFGVRGEPPSHPELLDWLASELVAGGWRLKPIHRLMVTSAAYRQSSRPNPGAGRRRPRQHAARPDESPPARRRGRPRRHAGRLGRAEPQGGRARRPRAPREGGRGPDLHRGRGRRPLARGPQPRRAPEALALPLPQAERAATRSSTPSTPPTPRPPARAARRAPTPSRPSSCSTAISPRHEPGPWRCGSSRAKAMTTDRIRRIYRIVLAREPTAARDRAGPVVPEDPGRADRRSARRTIAAWTDLAAGDAQ